MPSPIEPNALERFHRDDCRKLSRRRQSAKKKRYAFQPDFHDLERRMMPTTFVVANTSDQGLGSLRQAILDSNAAGGTNNVAFEIPDNNSNPEAYVITLTSGPLPAITNALTVEGTTETAFLGKPAIVEIDGSSLSGTPDGLTLSTGSNGSEIVGVQILDFGGDGILVQSANNTIGAANAGFGNLISGNTAVGVQISGANATGNLVAGNLIGTDSTGTVALANGTGVQIDTGAPGNTIGGTAAGTRNVISGNQANGVEIDRSSRNVVTGNFIGINAAGSSALPNGAYGVFMTATSSSSGSTGIGNLIGGTGAGAGNAISGNRSGGIYISGGALNVVAGNFIGTDATGDSAVPNSGPGVIVSRGYGNSIGGTTAPARNIISGNQGDGVRFEGGIGNAVAGNFIGVNAAGSAALGNGKYGVYVTEAAGTSGSSASRNMVGGAAAGAGNVISGNASGGIYISEGIRDIVAGNFIGTDATGESAVPNSGPGVVVSGGTRNTIGGTTVSARNIISGNQGNGVELHRSAGTWWTGTSLESMPLAHPRWETETTA